jgi:2-polyprenyl-6-hydroxyphenyl methylase/3-demethylubiquinone-9 3-methyltransferase
MITITTRSGSQNLLLHIIITTIHYSSLLDLRRTGALNHNYALELFFIMNAINKYTLQCVRRGSLSQHTKIQFRTNCSSVMRYGLSSSTVPVWSNKNENRKRQRQSRVFSSVSEEEVSKFSKFSKTWWDPQENPLIGMNSIRVQYIVNEMHKTLSSADVNNHNNTPRDDVERSSQPSDEFPRALSGLKAVDVGCGGGLLSESMARLGADVVAVDPSHTLVEHAKRHADMDPRTRSIDYRGGYTVEQLAQETSDPCYDIVCILEVVEHVTDVESILTSAKSLLKPNTGRLFLSTINRTIKSQIVAIIGAEYVMGYLPPGTHDWNQFRSPQEVEELMGRAGLKQVDVQGMVIAKPPFQGRWDWKLDQVDTDVNWIGTYKIA